MITAKFHVGLPEDVWVAEVSRAFPDATFRLLSGVRTGDTAIELGEVVADEPAPIGDAIEAHPSIETYTDLGAAAGRLLARYESTDVDLYEFVASTSLAPEYPLAVRDGWFEFDLTGTRADLDRLRETLEQSGLPFELRSVVEAPDPASLLTDRQREVLEAALRAGYFEVPRESTLAEVADAVGADESTVSGVLRRGQARVLERFLTGPAGTTP